MADLLTTFANTYRYNPNSAFEGAQNMQTLMANSLDYQQKREALEAQRSLKDLYSRNPQPSFEDIARIDPTFAMQQQLSNVELQGKMLNMQKTQGDITDQQRSAFARTAAPIAEKYAGMQMNPQTMSQFHQEMGGALAQFEQQTGIKPPPGFNVEALSPESVLMWSMPYYKSPTMENISKMQGEQMMSGVPQRPSYSDVAGQNVSGPYGTRYIPPVGMPGRGTGVVPFIPQSMQELPAGSYMEKGPLSPDEAQNPIPINPATDLPALKSTYAAMQPGPARDALAKNIADIEAGRFGQMPSQPQMGGQMPSAAPSGIVTPADEMRMRAEEERIKAGIQAEAAGIRKTAETAAERKAEGERITGAFKRAVGEGGVSRVMRLIAESTSGPTEELAAGIVGGIPRPGGSRSTAGMEKIGALTTVAKELAKTIERSPGPQSDKDVALAALAAAAIDNPSIPYNQRMAGFLEFTRIIAERANELGLDPASIGIDVNAPSASGQTAQAQQPSTGRLRIGDVKDGYEYLGGNPNSQSSWRKSR